MKLALLAVGAFLVSLTGTAVTVVMVSGPEPVPAPAHAETDEQVTGDGEQVTGDDEQVTGDDEQVTGDSAVAETAGVSHDSRRTVAADSVADLAEATDTSQTAQGDVTPEDDSAPSAGASGDSGAVDPPVEIPATATSPPSSPTSLQGSTMRVAADVDPAADEESVRQTARIFSAMRASNAAAVLVHLTDDEIVGILKFFNARKAAAVLSEFSEERAASISRMLLRRHGTAGGRQ